MNTRKSGIDTNVTAAICIGTPYKSILSSEKKERKPLVIKLCASSFLDKSKKMMLDLKNQSAKIIGFNNDVLESLVTFIKSAKNLNANFLI